MNVNIVIPVTFRNYTCKYSYHSLWPLCAAPVQRRQHRLVSRNSQNSEWLGASTGRVMEPCHTNRLGRCSREWLLPGAAQGYRVVQTLLLACIFFFFMAFSATLEEFLNPKLPLHAFYLILEKTYCSHLCFPDLVLQSTFKNILILEIQRQAEEFLKNMPKSQCMLSCVVYSKRDIQLHLW